MNDRNKYTRDHGGAASLPSQQPRSRVVPLAFLFTLVAGNLLFPDTYTDWGLELGAIKLTMIPILFAITAPFIIYYSLQERPRLQPGAIDTVFIALLTYIAVRGLVAAGNDSRMIIAFVAYAFVLYYGTRLLVSGDREILAASIFMVALGTFIAAYAIVELFARRNFLYSDDMIPLYLLDRGMMSAFEGDPGLLYRSNSTIGHPIALGLVLLQFLPFAFYLTSRTRRLPYLLLLGAAIAINVFAVVATYSKSATVTGAVMGIVAFALYFHYRERHRKRLLAAAALVLTAAGALVALRFEGLLAYNSATLWKSSISGRLDPVADLFSGDAQALILGKGLFQNGSGGIWYDSAYTSTIYEQGLVGFALAGLFLFLLGKQIVTLLASGGRMRLLAAAIAFSMSAILVNGLTFPTFITWPNMVIFFLVAGFSGSVYRIGRERSGSGGKGEPAVASGDVIGMARAS